MACYFLKFFIIGVFTAKAERIYAIYFLQNGYSSFSKVFGTWAC